MNDIILHIPHASLNIPDKMRSNILLDGPELAEELMAITDRYVDELFAMSGVRMIVSPVSRLLVDMERFRSDEDEVMAGVGMGAVYERTSGGKRLRDLTPAIREAIMREYYDPYHRAFEEAVAVCLNQYTRCVIIDCHSFPSRPLPYEVDQDPDRAEICLGTCDYHTPRQLMDFFQNWMLQHFTVAVNRPFAGTFVPSRFYRREKRVSSIMIEVNRSLYMDETNGDKNNCFGRISELLKGSIQALPIL